MNHREWDEDITAQRSASGISSEHNATVRAYRDAMAECERLGKANGDACDRIAELESRDSIMAKERAECWRILNAANLNLCPTADLGFAVKQLLEVESRPVLTWEECEAEFRQLCDRTHSSSGQDNMHFRDWLKSRLPAPTDSIRVPFSDAQIERMAKAARRVLLGSSETDANWPLWYSAIRAALAAGGGVRVMGEEWCYNCDSNAHLALQCPYLKRAPAQEEKEMVCCKSCGARIGMGIYCEPCERQLPNEKLVCSAAEAEEVRREYRKYKLEQLHRDAALAALSPSKGNAAQNVCFAIEVADEFVRQYNPNAVIAEVVG